MNIAEKNDLMRKTFMGCRVLLTEGVQALDPIHQSAVIEAVQKFKDFEPGNDPYGEHDFGKVTIGEANFFWKFDYYDDTYEFYQADGNRVLTIMRADEY